MRAALAYDLRDDYRAMGYGEEEVAEFDSIETIEAIDSALRRLGYAAGPEPIIREMTKLQQYTFVCAPSMVQKAGVAAMDVDITGNIDAYRHKRDLVHQGLKDHYDVVRPEGGFYIFPKVPSAYPNGKAFVEKAIANNLLIIPGGVFSERDTHFRISYAVPDERIQAGCEVLRRLAAG